MAQNVSLIVKIGGKQYSPVSYCSINQRIDWHHSFEIILPQDGFTNKSNTILDQTKDFIGQKIEIAFKIKKPEESDLQNQFTGIITEVSLNRRNRGNKEILVRGHSPTILLDGRPNCRSFAQNTQDEIVNELIAKIAKNDLPVNCSPVYKKQIPYITQYKESNFHFLNRLADQHGEWCFYNGTQLNFGKLEKPKKIDIPIDKNLSDFDFAMKIQNINYKSVTYDYNENQTYDENDRDLQVNDQDLYGSHALDRSENVFKQENVFFPRESFASQEELKEHCETRKTSRAKELVFVTGSSDNPYVNVGSVINITGEGANEEDFGEFIIMSIHHSIDITANYTNRFTAIPANAKVPPPNRNIWNPSAESQPAVVTDNNDPSGNLGRVRVRFFWQDKDETPWIRVLQPWGGKLDGGEQHGFYFIPEIGDEVMIGFENDNPDKPFVMGSAYHKNSSSDYWYHEKNNLKSIRTRNGNQIIFIDEDGKEEIRIVNKDEKSPTNEISLSLSDKGKITIKTEGELEFSADSIKISATNDIVIDSGKTTKLAASDYQLKADNGINISGQELKIDGTNTSLKGSGKLEVEGGQADIKAQTLGIDGGGQAEIKAAVISINGSAQVEVKAGVIMLN